MNSWDHRMLDFKGILEVILSNVLFKAGHCCIPNSHQGWVEKDMVNSRGKEVGNSTSELHREKKQYWIEMENEQGSMDWVEPANCQDKTAEYPLQVGSGTDCQGMGRSSSRGSTCWSCSRRISSLKVEGRTRWPYRSLPNLWFWFLIP